MEQAFELVNRLLARDEGGRRRNLKIRTYKVIPLQNSNGLIEFVANTAPLGNFLVGLYECVLVRALCARSPSPARALVSDADSLSPSRRQMAPGVQKRARDQLRVIEGKHKNHPDRRDADKDKAFRKILAETPPLLRYLFWQKHKVPSLWFDMRLNYSRSVATTSIIGHVVGLGDRHVSNILMDEARGELVHIDLGIAFDQVRALSSLSLYARLPRRPADPDPPLPPRRSQGKRLPIPELVPFRLTQNIVDGFGMSGVDGVFRRCCEETLRVLRERSSVIMTILGVFKHDPLQNWCAPSPSLALSLSCTGTTRSRPTRRAQGRLCRDGQADPRLGRRRRARARRAAGRRRPRARHRARQARRPPLGPVHGQPAHPGGDQPEQPRAHLFGCASFLARLLSFSLSLVSRRGQRD